MAYLKITGKVLSQPLTIANDKHALVMLVVKTGEVCKELYYQQTVHSSNDNFATKFVRTKFSEIAFISSRASSVVISSALWSITLLSR